MEERLQKILAAAGLGSRRSCEELITKGLVKVNGRVVKKLGSKADPDEDIIAINNKKIGVAKKIYLVLNKPKGYITSLYDPEGRPTVKDLIKTVNGRVYPVGRLDYDSEGLIFLTNDGELANRLMHPRYKIWKTYYVVVHGSPDALQIKALEKGVVIEGVRSLPAKIKVLEKLSNDQTSIYLDITEGKKHQVKNMLGTIGLPVRYLKRVKIGCVKLGDLARGKYRYLTKEEVKELKKILGLASSISDKR